MREPRDPLLKVVLIACDRKGGHSTLYRVCVKTRAPLGTSRKGTHAVVHIGVRWMFESTWACTTKKSATALVPQLYDNDPSAGSPTETLLRLLLPLNDQV